MIFSIMGKGKELRTATLFTNATPSEKATIEEAAKREGLSRAQFMIEAAIERASGDAEIAKQVLREEIRGWPPEVKAMMAVWAK